MQTPLTSYNLKQITPYVEKFSTAADATGGSSPLLPKDSAGEGCCVSYFHNYLMFECVESLTGAPYDYNVSCINFEATEIDPFPTERNTVAGVISGSVNSNCDCLQEYPFSSSSFGRTTYSFSCPPEGFYKPNFGGPQILVYPGCTVKISAEGKTFPYTYFYYHQPFQGYVYITESSSEACCGELSCISPSEVEVNLPMDWDLSTGLTSGCYEFSDLKYRFLYASFFNDDLPTQPTTCCPGHTLLTPSDPDPCYPSTPFGSYYCVASRGTDCTSDGLCGVEYPEPGSQAYCGYYPFYSCSEVLKSVDDISITYTNKTNCVAVVYMSFFEDYYWYQENRFNACFSDFNLKYKVEVLSGGCNSQA